VPEAKQTPAALQAWVKDEINKWAPLLKAAGQYAD
jgi:tripartite-type tricarboxylate transporter receptor subunit TctC